jgi:hypothetical protein
MVVKIMSNQNPFIFNFFNIGKEEEARVHQHMHVVAQRQVRISIYEMAPICYHNNLANCYLFYYF